MNLSEVKKILEENFSWDPVEGKRRHIIFWYDDEGEFVEDIEELRLENAKIIKLIEKNSFFVKYHLEQADTGANYLVYSPLPKPKARDNWLLDILKYSAEFSTDKTVLIMRNFGVKNSALRNVFKKYLKFFGNKERYQKFGSYSIDHYDEEKVETAVLSTLCRLPVADFEQVLKRLLIGETEKENKFLEAINSFGDPEAFWRLAEKKYGYAGKDRSLERLFVMLAVTHLSYSMEENLPATWKQFVSMKKADCVVFVSNFMNHAADSRFYDLLADRTERILNIKTHVNKWDLEKYLDSDTFRVFDERIIGKLRDNLYEDIGEYDKYRKIINRRRTSHWFSHFRHEYEALHYAVEILELKKKIGKTIKGDSTLELLENYTKKYYQMDFFYRKFYLHYDKINNKDPFIQLAEKIENIYVHWYLNELSVKWSSAVEDELPDDYTQAGIPRQKDFYRDHLSFLVRNKERVFVIVSDALRYEVGHELLNLLNKETRGAAEIDFLQGVVPSTTKFGMASLLPRKSMEIRKTEIVIDGISTQGIKNREEILSNYCRDALAVQYQDLVDMKRPEYKKNFNEKKLVYIYHNIIDAVGDKSSTERDVFDAVERALAEVVQLVKNLVNHVSATKIFITADHGFIYRRSPLTEIDKTARHNIQTLEEGRRYMLSETSEKPEGTLSIPMKYLLGEKTKLKAVVPKGVIRYKVQGAGANYVHGGVSLQEIIIPMLKFKYIRKDEYKATKVTVKLTNISRKITNRITYLEFFQMEKMEDKKLPLKLKLYFVDEEGNRISNENIIIADSRSKKPEDRIFREKFTLKDLAYDKTRKYYLILEDEEEPVEKIYEKISFTIDLLVSDEFGF